jgi:O-antigen ligase
MLGVGAKCFTVHSERYHVPSGQHQAHNQLMNVAAETGMVGLICFLAWMAYYAVFLFKLRHLRTGTISRAMWLAAMGSFVVVAAHGIVDASFGAELALLFMLITGCLIAAKALEDSPLEEAPPLNQDSSKVSF